MRSLKELLASLFGSRRKSRVPKQEGVRVLSEEEKKLQIGRYLDTHRHPQMGSQIIAIGVFGIPGADTKGLIELLVYGERDRPYEPCGGDSDGSAEKIIRFMDRQVQVVFHTSSTTTYDLRTKFIAVSMMSFYILAYDPGSIGSLESLETAYYQIMDARRRWEPDFPWQGGMVVSLAAKADNEQADKIQLGRDFAGMIGVDFLDLSLESGRGCSINDLEPLLVRLINSAISEV